MDRLIAVVVVVGIKKTKQTVEMKNFKDLDNFILALLNCDIVQKSSDAMPLGVSFGAGSAITNRNILMNGIQ